MKLKQAKPSYTGRQIGLVWSNTKRIHLLTWSQGAISPKHYLVINHLNPTGHVMHHHFNIQQLYVLPTLYLCVLCLFENKERLVPLTA